MRSRIRIDLVPLLLLAAVAGLLLAGPSAFGGSGDVDNPDHFELGDGVDPDVPGVGDIEGEVQLQGPDWTDLFDADGNLRDVRDEYGGDVANGVPDLLDTWGAFRARRDAVFSADPLGSTSTGELTAIVGPDLVGAGSVLPEHDLTNSYAYLTYDENLDLILYAAVERTAVASSVWQIEILQRRSWIDADGAVHAPSAEGDLIAVLTFDPDLVQIEVRAFAPDPETGELTWQTRAILSGETCNESGSLCAYSNALSIPGGSWTSFEPDGSLRSTHPPGAFVEIGVDLGAMIGGETRSRRYHSLRVETPEDIAIESFTRAARRGAEEGR